MGTDIVRYDIYGKDVVIANKMESNGEKGKVQVSEKTKELIEMNFSNYFAFEFNKSIKIGSQGETINGYFVKCLYSRKLEWQMEEIEEIDD